MEQATNQDISINIQNLPHKPGVYQFFDVNKTLIYVGKAKDLKKRVSSYFNKKSDNYKTSLLINNIRYLEYIVVETEVDALLLENALIKKYQPKYNIQLKDDSSYPWIVIKKEAFPRIFYTRKFLKDGSEYFGPFPSVKTISAVMDFIRQTYKIRTCKLGLNTANIEKKKFKVCLEYHIKNCQGPCEGLQSEEDYMQNIQEIRNLLKGNIHVVLKDIRTQMLQAAENLNFELAQTLKERLLALEKYQSKSLVVNPDITDVDVFAIDNEENVAYVNFLKINNGTIVQAHNLEIKKKIEESAEDILIYAINDIRQRFESHSKEIIVPIDISYQLPNAKLIVPKIGDKKKLLELAETNLKYFKLDRLKHQNITDPEAHTLRILKKMQQDLRMQEQPKHIECFDNSNLQGSNPVSAMVCFKNAKPSKKDYRIFNVKSVEGPNDFASMHEVITRRYKYLLNENLPLPQLIIIDGGKGQLTSALDALEALGLRGKITVISIAKRLEEIYFPNDPYPLSLDKRSETLKIIQQLRDEAHRFGIKHHRNKRIKTGIQTELTQIKGIGEKLAQKLLTTYKSVANIKALNQEELAKTIGNKKAEIIFNYFHPKT